MAEAQPNKPLTQTCPGQKTWIEFRLVDADNNPVPGEPYRVRLPDQSLMTGRLDREGKIRFDGILPGQASINFPGMDRKEWRPI